jgi:polyisoprenoid-binding protein YceI
MRSAPLGGSDVFMHAKLPKPHWNFMNADNAPKSGTHIAMQYIAPLAQPMSKYRIGVRRKEQDATEMLAVAITRCHFKDTQFMNRSIRMSALATAGLLLGLHGSLSVAAPVQHTIDPQHTYPSFEASHMGISAWRGKFDKTSGTATFDEVAGRGVVDIVVDLKSVDFGLESLNEFMVGPEFFDVTKFSGMSLDLTPENLTDSAWR